MSEPKKTDPAETSGEQDAEASETAPEGEAEGEEAVKVYELPDEETTGSTDLESALLAKEEEARALSEKYVRICAELDNFKKRTAKDRADQLRYANESLLKDLLPVLDNLERAIEHMKAAPDVAKWVEGVELTHRQSLDVMKRYGVVPIESLGEPFDPSVHQAVAFVDTNEHAENTVAEELQKGYRYHDRILRPAMVAVARTPSGEKTEAPESPAEEEERSAED